MPPFAYTNIKLDDKVGEMRWYYDGRYIGSLDITAMKNARFESVEKSEKNILEKIKDFLFNN